MSSAISVSAFSKKIRTSERPDVQCSSINSEIPARMPLSRVWQAVTPLQGPLLVAFAYYTGGGVAVPIFEPIMQAAWANVAPKTALAPPSPEAKRHLACKSVETESDEASDARIGARECLRVDGNGKVIETKYRLQSHRRTYAKHDRDEREDPPRRTRERTKNSDDRARSPAPHDPRRATSQWGWQWENAQRWRQEAQHPAYFWGGWRQ
jgi:hypothetical protein